MEKKNRKESEKRWVKQTTTVENGMDSNCCLGMSIEEYKNIFGRNSLDYVIICDPRLMDVDNFNSGIKKLEDGKMIPKEPKEFDAEDYKKMEK